MANRERGELRLVAPDRTFVLRLTVAACCELEDQADRTLADLIAGANAGRATDLRWLLWAALQDRHAAQVPTPSQAGTLADRLGGVRALRAAVVALIRLNEDDSPPEPSHGSSTTDEPGSRWRRLYIDARRAGIAPDQFWRLSLRELWRELAAQREVRREAIDRDRTVAWMTAALHRTKTLPSLDRFVGRQPVAQTPEQLRGMLHILRAQYPKTRHAKGTRCTTPPATTTAM